MITLNNNILKADIQEPGERYSRSRFDWTGIVEQVTLEKSTFLTSQAHGDYKDSEGFGLISEFSMFTPLSYWKTLPGREFMKIGVGVLTRDSIRPYSSGRDYKIRPFKTELVKHSNSKVEFIQNDCRVGSYGCDYSKTITIEDNRLIISYKLKNTGELLIKTEEYNHNFLRIDDEDITTKTRIKCNHSLPVKKKVGPLSIDEGTVNITKENNLIYLRSFLKKKPENFLWTAANGEKSFVECRENFPASIFAAWGMKHVISPETFHSFAIPPGDTLKWSRVYIFTSKK